MTDSLVFAKITLQVMPSMYLSTVLKTAISNGDHVLRIFIDVSKVFDTIDHNILLSKLMKYRVRGQPYDTNIFVKAKSLKLANQAANEPLGQINDYMVCNKLHINLEKSYYMHLVVKKLYMLIWC